MCHQYPRFSIPTLSNLFRFAYSSRESADHYSFLRPTFGPHEPSPKEMDRCATSTHDSRSRHCPIYSVLLTQVVNQRTIIRFSAPLSDRMNLPRKRWIDVPPVPTILDPDIVQSIPFCLLKS